MQTRVLVLVFCPSYYCVLHLYEVSWKYLKRFSRYTADTCVWWKWQFSIFKGQNSKSRKTRITVHVFCMSSHGVNICVKFHENMSSGFKVMERTQTMLVDTHTHKKKLYTPLHAYFVCRGYNQSYGSCVLQAVSWFNICVKLHENMSSVLNLWSRHKNC